MLQRAIVILFVAGLVTAGLAAAPAWGETYHSQYSIGCTNIWPAVKATLGDQEHYAKVVINDEKMKADYQPKHTVHVDISGTLLQRMNHVTLKAKGDGGCEMDVVSNYSGWGHDDQSDFKKRVDTNLTAKAPGAQPAAAAADAGKPADAAKPATTAEAQKPQ